MTVNLETLAVKLTADASQFSGELNKAQSKTSKFAQGVTSGLRTVGAAALGIGVAGVAAVGAAAITASKDFVAFEQGMNEVFTLMPDISGAAMDEMTGQVKDLSKEFGVMPEEVVPALYQSISAGVPRENVFDFLETAQKAAAGGVTDLTTAVDGISSVVNAYGEDVVNAGEASDLMFTAVRLGKTNFEELSSSLFQVIPTASSMGVAFGDVTASLATLTAQGTPTSVATTQLRQALVEASKSGSDLSSAIVDLTGSTFPELIEQGQSMPGVFDNLRSSMPEQGFKDLFGSVEAMNAVLGITGPNFDATSAAMDEMSNSAGATDEAFERMDGGLKATANRLKAMGKVALLDFAGAFEPLLVMAADFAEDLLPKIGDVLDSVVIPAVEAFAGWIQTTAEAISAGGIQQLFTTFEDGSSRLGSLIALFGVGEEKAHAIGAAINNFVASVQSLLGPIMAAIGQFVSWKDVLLVLGVAIAAGIALIVGPLVLAIAKIGLIIAGVIAVVAVLRNAWENNWGGIQEKTAAVVAFIRMAIQAVQQVVQLVLGQIQSAWAQHGDGILNSARNAWNSIKGAIDAAINFVKGIITTVGNAIKVFWQTFQTEILTFTQGVWDALMIYIDGALNQISIVFDIFAALFSGDWAALGDGLKRLWDNTWTTILAVIETLWSAVLPLMTSLWESFSAWFTEQDWGALAQKILDGIEGVLSGLWDFVSETVSGWWDSFTGWFDEQDWGALGQTVLDGIVDTLGGFWDSAVETVGGWWDSFTTWFDEQDWSALGSDIIDGVVSGINSAGDAILGALGGAVQGGIDYAKGLLGIDSPSKVFAEIGGNMVQGAALGVERQQRALENAMANAIGSLTGGRGLPMMAMENTGSARYGPQFIMNIHNNSRQEDLMGDFRLMEAMAGGI